MEMNAAQKTSSTVVDVARKAGVSVGTVSRVLNGYSSISPENVDRVQRAIEELGYRKSRSADPLINRRRAARASTGNIGLIYAEMDGDWANHPLVAAYSVGVEKACQEKGFHALIEFSNNDGSLPRCVRENKVDALLIKATRTLPPYLGGLSKELPVVCVGFNKPTVNMQQVASDDHGAGWLVADYLWSLGHRRIGIVCPDLGHPMLLARYQGYEAFLRSQHRFDPALCILAEPTHSIEHPEYEPPDMSQAVEKLLAVPGDPITAIITANDWIAYGLYPALAAAGKSVPEDISVVGFDNYVTVCATLRPQLTSYAVPFGDVAYVSTLKAIDRIQNQNSLWDHSLHLVRGEIIERSSVRPLTEK